MKYKIVINTILSFMLIQNLNSQEFVSSLEKYSFINFTINPLIFVQNKHDYIQPENKISKLELIRDTITDYFDRSSGFNMYLYRDQNQILRPVTGTNEVYHLLGVKYDIKAADLLGVLVAFGTKIVSGEPDSLAMLISAADDSTGLPVNPILANTGFSVNDLDTNGTIPTFTPIMLKEPASIDGKFAIMIQVWTQTDESDLVVVWSNKQGDAKGENTAFFSVVQEQGIAYNFDQFPVLMDDSLPPNFDLMILPVIEKDVVSTENNFHINNLTVSFIYPNPSKDKAYLDIMSKDENQIEITIIDLTGKLVSKQIIDNLNTGKNTVGLDLKQLPNGTYFCIVRTINGAFAQKLAIEK